MGPEARLERRLVDRLRSIGCLCPKFTTTERGWPDRIVVMPGGRTLWVEMKQPGGRLARYQEVVHERLRRMGADVRVIWNRNQVDTLVEEIRDAL